MPIQAGCWLGIDVGSARDKVYTFCLIRSDGNGGLTVAFEGGKARGLAAGLAFPPSDAGVFEDLNQPTWLSAGAEAGAVQILNRSMLVQMWTAAHAAGNGLQGVCIDAPCGFAMPGFAQRLTETAGVGTYPTPPLATFLMQLGQYAAGQNHTPLRQRFFWKLMGLVAFRHFVALTTGQPFAMPIAAVTATCMANHPTKVREGFPSDTYARANGTVGMMGPAARQLLYGLAHTPWEAAGNVFAGISSAPQASRMSRLRAHQTTLRADLGLPHNLGAITSMQKIPDDPAWADLWDAFILAFVSCCYDQGWGAFVGGMDPRILMEGAILRPA